MAFCRCAWGKCGTSKALKNGDEKHDQTITNALSLFAMFSRSEDYSSVADVVVRARLEVVLPRLGGEDFNDEVEEKEKTMVRVTLTIPSNDDDDGDEEEEEEEEEEEDDGANDNAHRHERNASFLSNVSSIITLNTLNAEDDAEDEEAGKRFLFSQDEKIGHLEEAIAFTEEDFVRPKFAASRGAGTGTTGRTREQQQRHDRTESSLNNATTCSILSLEDSALEAEALAARGRMYEQNTDLMGEEEEVDPRVETALEDLNDAAEEVNKAEQEYDRGKRTLREEKERAKEAVDGMYKQLSGAVKKAVPALHKRAVASLYQNRSQEAMIAHAECFDHHEKCKRTVSKLERMLAKRREEGTRGDGGGDSPRSCSSSSSSSFSKDEDEDEDKENVTDDCDDEEDNEHSDIANPELATSPSASPKKKKKKRKKKKLDKSNLRLLEKLSEAVANVAEAERVMRRALLAHETNAKLAMEAVDECARLSSNTKNIRAIKKAQPYFAIKKEGEDAIEKLESSVKEMRARVKSSKARYGECLEQLDAISKEIHERRELEKKTKALKLMKSATQ